MSSRQNLLIGHPARSGGGALGFPVAGLFSARGFLSFTFGGEVPWNAVMHMLEPTMFIGLAVYHGGDPWVVRFWLVSALLFAHQG